MTRPSFGIRFRFSFNKAKIDEGVSPSLPWKAAFYGASRNLFFIIRLLSESFTSLNFII